MDENRYGSEVRTPADLITAVSSLQKELRELKTNMLIRDISSAVDKAEYWLFKSGIIVSSKQPESGAVYYHYNSEEQAHELIHAESVGYCLSFLSYLFTLYKDVNLITLAKVSGDWLVEIAKKYDGIIIMGIRTEDVKTAYTFDNGICCKGLLDLYEITGDKKYLDSAEKIADWLVKKSLNADGSIKPEYDIDSGKFVEAEDSWWRASGSFHSKIVMPLFQLHSINNQDRFLEAAIKICEWCLRQQRPDGSFPVNKYFTSVSMHPLCYTIEALLYAFSVLKRQDFLVAAQKAIDWILGVQEPDGSVLLFYGDDSVKAKPVYAIAQVIRILLLMHSVTHEERLIDAAQRAARFIVRFQSYEHDARSYGGFYEYTTSYEFIAKHRQVYASKFKKSPHISPWGTMFAIQALTLLEANLSSTGSSPDFNVEIKKLF